MAYALTLDAPEQSDNLPQWLTERETTGKSRQPQSEPYTGVSSLPSPRLIRVTAPGQTAALAVHWHGWEPDWLRPVLETLVQLLALSDNWNSYGARPVGVAAAEASLALLREVMPDTAPPPQVVPTSAGGVQLEWHTGGVDLEVSVRPSGEAFVLFEDLRTEEEWEGPLPARRDDLAAALAVLAPGP